MCFLFFFEGIHQQAQVQVVQVMEADTHLLSPVIMGKDSLC